MGALTIGIVVPDPVTPSASSATLTASAVAASNELQAIHDDWRSARDLQEAAATLSIDARLLSPSSFTSPRAHACERLLVCASGPAGGSGSIHAAARAAGLPVLGPSAETLARAYDKVRARAQLAHHNIPVPTSLALAGLDLAAIERLGWPCLLKPRQGSGGRGIVRLDSLASLENALAAVDDPSQWLIERDLSVEAPVIEVDVVVLRGRVLGMIEVARTWTDSGLQTRAMVCPPSISQLRRQGLANLALRAAACLGLSEGPTRVDLLCSARENEVVLEVEPLPALHRDSVVGRVARAEGMTTAELLAKVLVASDRARPHAPASLSA